MTMSRRRINEFQRKNTFDIIKFATLIAKLTQTITNSSEYIFNKIRINTVPNSLPLHNAHHDIDPSFYMLLKKQNGGCLLIDLF